MLGNPSGRSPLRPRQLHDLTLPPTKDDPRPTFFWSVEKPRNDGGESMRTHEFPKLMWTPEGVEITVHSKAEQATHAADGYQLVAPAGLVIDPMDEIQAQWDAFSPEDKALILDAQRKERIKLMMEKLSTLPEERLAAIVASTESPEVRRGPGRPRKDSL